MNNVEGSISYSNDGMEITDSLFTYSEEERQANIINEANAKKIFSPEFIPFYPNIQKTYRLSVYETLLYGFIRFYMANSSGRFYFTNEQLADMLQTSEKTISRAMGELTKKKLIITGYRIKGGGGTIRFISDTSKVPSQAGQIVPSDGTKSPANNNKIKENKIIGRDSGQQNLIPFLKEEKEKSSAKKEKEENFKGIDAELQEVVDHFNVVYKSRYGVGKLLNNYLYWRDSYSVDQIKLAISNSVNDRFWKKALTPEKLLRRRDTRGELVDRIGELLNVKKPMSPEEEAFMREFERAE